MAAIPTDRDRWRQIEPILDQALDTPLEERSAFLDQACFGRPRLRAEVERVLDAEARAGGFLEAPVGEVAATLLGELEEETGGPLTDRFAGSRFGPYHVIRRIGGGGMGVVYEARDTRLKRRVALKFLPGEWSRDPAAKTRFVREARAASALDHSNICTVYDIGETDDGQLFIVMAHYRGETLAQKLERGPLAIDRAVELARQVARGLEHAHQAGVTHRDVKPANIMVTDRGEAKILDFGIARVAGDAGLTRTGDSPGTPAYMSPEQARGDAVDNRTDVWSLAVILYQMIAGQLPFPGAGAQATIYSILNRDPKPLSATRDGVAGAVERAVIKGLAKDPDERYQRVRQLLTALESSPGETPLGSPWPRPGLAVAGIAAAAALWLGSQWLSPDRPEPPPEIEPTMPAVADEVPVVGVLPFANRTGDPTLDWYGEGVARLITDNLVQSRLVQVVSARRVESLATAADSLEIAGLAAERGIGFLLTGELLAGSEGLVLAARLGQVEDGRELAAHHVRALKPEELLRAADEMAQQARRGLGIPPTETVDVFAADFAARHPEAYASYLKGLESFTRYRYSDAERAFTDALEKAPDFTMARYRLAHVLAAASRTDEALVEIRQALLETDRLADRDGRYVRTAEAYISRRYDEAIEGYQQLIDDYPYETEARYLLAHLLKAGRRFEDEIQVLDVLQRLEPESHSIWSMRGSAHLALGNLNRAVLDLQRYAELAPEVANSHLLLGDAYRAQGEIDLAATKYAEALNLDPTFHASAVSLAIVDALRGQSNVAEERLMALIDDTGARIRYRIDATFQLAWLHRSHGRFRQAAELLEREEPRIAKEEVRAAMALSVRATSWLELGEYDQARRLVASAVERSPGVATRYLFARGLIELHTNRFQSLDETIVEILRGALPPDSPDRTEEKAAAYLKGLSSLRQDEPKRAVEELSRAVALEGYEYRLYRLGLARAFLAAGRLDEAMAASRQASEQVELVEPRLDLELDRARAVLVLARIQAGMGRPSAAATHARFFLERWRNADPELADLAEARRLAVGAI